MRTKLLYLLILLTIACNNKSEINTRDAIPENITNDTKDVDTSSAIDPKINQVIANLYESINHDGDDHPDWETMRSVFIDDAYLIDVAETAYEKYTIGEYINAYRSDVEAGKYSYVTEYGLVDSGQMFGNVAQVFSSYITQIIISNSDTINKRGINSIQLIKDEGEWKITSIAWYDENEDNPLPDKFK